MKSKVLFAPMAYSRYEKDQTLPAKFDKMLDKCPPKGITLTGEATH